MCYYPCVTGWVGLVDWWASVHLSTHTEYLMDSRTRWDINLMTRIYKRTLLPLSPSAGGINIWSEEIQSGVLSTTVRSIHPSVHQGRIFSVGREQGRIINCQFVPSLFFLLSPCVGMEERKRKVKREIGPTNVQHCNTQNIQRRAFSVEEVNIDFYPSFPKFILLGSRWCL